MILMMTVALKTLTHTKHSPVWTSGGLSVAVPSPVCVPLLNWWPLFHHNCAWPSPPPRDTKALWQPLLSSLCLSKQPGRLSILLLHICWSRQLLETQKGMTVIFIEVITQDWNNNNKIIRTDLQRLYHYYVIEYWFIMWMLNFFKSTFKCFSFFLHVYSSCSNLVFQHSCR